MFNLRTKAARVVGMAVAAGGLTLLAAPAAWAATSETGSQIVNPTTGTPLTGVQASSTPFQIALPSGAACSGDTTGSGYHIYGYLVPSTTDPASLTYNAVGPNGGLPLITPQGLYSAKNTVPTTGEIPEPTPSMSFGTNYGAFGTTLKAGTYNIGISCVTSAGVADNFWNGQVTFAASTSDPNGYTYTVGSPAPSTPEAPFAVALPLSAVALVGVGALVLRRRRRSAVGV